MKSLPFERKAYLALYFINMCTVYAERECECIVAEGKAKSSPRENSYASAIL